MEFLSRVGQTVDAAARSLNRWIKRHRRGLFIAGVIGGAAWFIARFARYRMLQFRQRLEAQERNLSKLRMQTYFDSLQKTCNSTATTFLGTLRQNLTQMVEIPNAAQLKSRMQISAEEKVAAWEDMKIAVFTRTVAAVYGICLMVLLLRVKVNILGRYLYIDNSISASSSSGSAAASSSLLAAADDSSDRAERPLSAETQKNYLALVEHMLSSGLRELTSYVRQQVRHELAAFPLHRRCTFDELCALLLSVRRAVERLPLPPPAVAAAAASVAPSSSSSVAVEPPLADVGDSLMDPNAPKQLHVFLLPPTLPDELDAQQAQDKQLASLLNETRDVLESHQFAKALRVCLDDCFAAVELQLRAAFVAAAASAAAGDEPGNGSGSLQQPALPVAKIIPIVKKLFDVVLSSESVDEALLLSLLQLDELQDYSYYVFTSAYDE